MNPEWIITKSEDETEWQLTGVENLKRQPKLTLDTTGKPMIEVKRFRAPTWEDAKKEMDRVRGWT